MPDYDKLVRDHIPERLRELGIAYEVRTLDDPEEFRRYLFAKLREEFEEFERAPFDSERFEELADLLEVVYAIADLIGSREELERRRKAKARTRGGFEARLLLVSTDE